MNLRPFRYLLPRLLPSATKFAKVMFLHLSVILSMGGGSASVHAGIPPPPWEQTPPLGVANPHYGPGTPWEQTPPGPGTRRADPPRQTATVADGTHPTGMHSCLVFSVYFTELPPPMDHWLRYPHFKLKRRISLSGFSITKSQ